MARMRTVKPGFFTSEDVAALSLRSRLTWIGLWTYCDDDGRGKANLKLIKAAVWMLDDITLQDVQDDLLELARAGRLTLYQVDGMKLLQVTNWHAHQHPNKPQRSKFPPPPGKQSGRDVPVPVMDREPVTDEFEPPPDDLEPPMRDDDVPPSATNAKPLRADERRTNVARTVGEEGRGIGVGGEGSAHETRENTPPTPRPDDHCSTHPSGWSDPCGACGTAKKARHIWDTEDTRRRKLLEVEQRRASNAARLAAIDQCQLCDPTGYRLLKNGDGTGGICDHIHRDGNARARAFQAIGDFQAIGEPG